MSSVRTTLFEAIRSLQSAKDILEDAMIDLERLHDELETDPHVLTVEPEFVVPVDDPFVRLGAMIEPSAETLFEVLVRAVAEGLWKREDAKAYLRRNDLLAIDAQGRRWAAAMAVDTLLMDRDPRRKGEKS